jgi:hypothetical protein
VSASVPPGANSRAYVEDWVALFKSNTIKYPVIAITLGRYDHSVNAKVKAETDWRVHTTVMYTLLLGTIGGIGHVSRAFSQLSLTDPSINSILKPLF